MALLLRFLTSLLLFVSYVQAKFYFQETFDEKWKERWTISDWHKPDGGNGDWKWTAGKWYGDQESDKGIQTTPDAKFFAISAALPESFDNKESDLVIQYSVKHEQKIDCGGGYIKLLPESSGDKMGKDFTGDTPYLIMFGPDICGGKKKVHVILWHNGTNHMTNEDIHAKSDELTHVYTLYINSKNAFKVFIDLEEVKSGDLFDGFKILEPRKIKDPDAVKPDDWDDRRKIPNPEDVKPEGYDDIPEFVVDKEAIKPDEWDEDSDGEWEPPKIKNPDFKGEWKPKMIENPNYKGKWSAPEIDNPDHIPDDTLYRHPNIKFVGFELWQVKSGSIFDNIIVGDNLEEALQFGRDTYGKSKDKEKAMYDEIKKKKDEEAATKKEQSDDEDNVEAIDDDQGAWTHEEEEEEEEYEDADEDYDPTHDREEL